MKAKLLFPLLYCMSLALQAQQKQAFLLLRTNESCEVFINGKTQGILSKDSLTRFEAIAGENLVMCRELQNQGELQRIIQIEAGYQKIWTFEFEPELQHPIDLLPPEEARSSDREEADYRYSFNWGAGPMRTLTYYPDPIYNSEEEGLITLTLTVKPDGTVRRIVPHPTTKLNLRRNAINALRNWRFSPLPSQVPQVDQKIIIDIPFLLKG